MLQLQFILPRAEKSKPESSRSFPAPLYLSFKKATYILNFENILNPYRETSTKLKFYLIN